MKAEEIEQRIKDEYRKHPNLDWAKIAAIKIHSTLMQKENLSKPVDPVGFAEWISGCMIDRATEKIGDEYKHTYWHDGTNRIANTTQELLNLYIESKKEK